MRPKTALVFVIALSLCYSLWGCLCGMNVYDEGIIVYGAQRVLSGDIIYKDFWTIYSPGQFWLVAVLFKLFGPTLLAGRFLTAIVNSASAVVVFLIARKLSRVQLSLIAWLLTLFWLNTYGSVSPAPTALLFVMISSLFLVRFFFGQKTPDLFLCGLFCGLALLFRHDLGAFTVLGQALILISYFICARADNPVRTIAFYLCGWSCVVAPCAAYLLINVPFGELAKDLFNIPLFVYPRARALTYPFIVPDPRQIAAGAEAVFGYFKQVVLRLDYYFPLVIYIAGLLSIRKAIRGRVRPFSAGFWAKVFFVALGMFFYIQGFVRGHLDHLRPTFIPAIIVLVILMEGLRRASPRICAACVMFAIFIAAMAWVPLSRKAEAVNIVRANPFYFSIPRAKHIVWDKRGKSYQELVGYIQRNVAENERIFVGNARHDRLFSSDVMLYFLSNRSSASKYHEFMPGIADTEGVQRRIISDLERFDVRYVFTWSNTVSEPNQSGVSGAVTLLDDFIRKNFKVDKNFGDYACWKRR